MFALALALATLVGVSLGLLGGGGSILAVPILRYALGLEAHRAIALSLLVVGSTSVAAVIPHAMRGRVRFRTGFLFGLTAMLGAFVAGRLAHFIPASVLLLALALVMVATALAMLRAPAAMPSVVAATRAELPILKVLVQGMFVGALTGLVGAGGGFVIVPALVLLGGLPIELAVGTSLVVIAMNSFAAFAGVAATVPIDGKIAGSLSAAAVVGSIGGSLLAHRVQPATLRAAFGWLVIAMAIFILGQELLPLFHAKASPKLAGALALVATSVFASLRVVWTRKCAQSDVLKLASQSATGGQTP
jgi:uncharacterized membrane protein YfcA